MPGLSVDKAASRNPVRSLRAEYIAPFEERVAALDAGSPGPEAMLRRRLLAIGRRRENETSGELGALWTKIRVAWQRCGWPDLFENRRSGTVVGTPRHCDQPLCPYCAPRRLAVHRRKYGQAFERPASERRLYFLVLTLRNPPLGQLATTLDLVRDAMTRLRRRKGAWVAIPALRGPVPARVIGGLWRVETTVNRRRRTWHPHLNVVIETDRPASMRDWRPQLVRAWASALGVDVAHLWLREAGAAGAADMREALKYSIKPDPSFADPDRPEWVVEYIEATRRRRLLNSFGSWRGLEEPEPEPMEETWRTYADDDPMGFVPRTVPVLDPLTDLPTEAADWVWRGDGPRRRLFPFRPPGELRVEWLVWHPSMDAASPIDAMDEPELNDWRVPP
jgi:hypothetical protein